MLPGLSWSVTTIVTNHSITTCQLIGNCVACCAGSLLCVMADGSSTPCLEGADKEIIETLAGLIIRIIAELHVVRTSAVAGSFST
jgi:hypothetical protein